MLHRTEKVKRSKYFRGPAKIIRNVKHYSNLKNGRGIHVDTLQKLDHSAVVRTYKYMGTVKLNLLPFPVHIQSLFFNKPTA